MALITEEVPITVVADIIVALLTMAVFQVAPVEDFPAVAEEDSVEAEAPSAVEEHQEVSEL